MAKYAVVSEMREGIETFKLQESDYAFAEIAPRFGNNCFAFCAPEPILEPISFDQFIKRPTSYGIPLLFPFPNRIRDGKFNFQGVEYKIDPPRHGFVRDKEWKVVATGAADSEGAWIRSSLDAADYAEEILTQFPFPFKLEVIYRLKDKRLEMELNVRNTGEREMPVGFGIHPYFHLPAQNTIQVPARKRWELSDSLPTGKLLKVEEQFDLRHPRSATGLTLDDIYTDVIPDEDGMVRSYLTDEQARRQMVVEFDAHEFPHVVVYTPPTPRQAICIEPNSCPTDGFNLYARGIESNMIILKAGAQTSFSVRIYVRK